MRDYRSDRCSARAARQTSRATTTHLYLDADLAMKEEALSRLQPVAATPGRDRAPDNLMTFLQAL
uniref:hypothetical protein n=1 Tax=uncultured Sphingomonas sp. TaxID=158754 RepID=UPI0035CBD3C2